ncbi:putative Spindle pole protein [Giardia muris]|uniref:Putative Spindle pole protein n=1 Tax=Giardia muris TaxID=5742 RepID=A0A4Z1SP13_GIAMU|nr:putative Spindle pole protein [Giardia muris]|eukprot:TNJ27552.1 putative Spindle pole protein [Giardia muris]
MSQTAEHLNQIASLQATVSSLQIQLRNNSDQLERLSRLQNAIVMLYIEFKDRTNETIRRDPEEERAELLGESPLVVLDKLRASLRFLHAFKDDFERELRATIARHVSEKETTTKDLAVRLVASQERIKELTNQLHTLKRQQEDATQRERAIKTTAETKMAAMEEQLASMQGKLSEKTDQLQGMKELVAERDELLRNRDTRLSRISQLESQLQLNRLQSQFNLSKVQTASRQKISQLEKESLKFNRLEAENADMRERIRQLNIQVASYQANIQQKKVKSLMDTVTKREGEIETLKKIIATRDDQLRASESALAQLRIQMASLEQRASLLNNETLELIGVGGGPTTQEQRPTTSPSRMSQARSPSKPKAVHKDFPPEDGGISQQHLIITYKDRLKEKDLEIEELAKRVRRLLTLQHRSALSQRAWEEERSRLEKQVSSLRDEVTQLRKLLGNRSSAVPSGDETRLEDDAIRDIQNLRAFAMATSHAFNQLRASEKAPEIQFATGLQELEPIPDPRERPKTAGAPPKAPQRNTRDNMRSGVSPTSSPVRRPISAASSNRPGRGAGYGAGYMLGRNARPRTAYAFGVQ